MHCVSFYADTIAFAWAEIVSIVVRWDIVNMEQRLYLKSANDIEKLLLLLAESFKENFFLAVVS